jgi:hypothetical protein
VDALVVRWEQTLAQYEALAAHARGRTVDGALAPWVQSLKRWSWVAVYAALALAGVPAWLLQIVMKGNHRALAPEQRVLLGQAQREISGLGQRLIDTWLRLFKHRW